MDKWNSFEAQMNLGLVAEQIVEALSSKLTASKQILSNFDPAIFRSLAETVTGINEDPPFFPPSFGERIDVGEMLRMSVAKLDGQRSFSVGQKDINVASSLANQHHQKSQHPVRAAAANAKAFTEVIESTLSRLREFGSFEVSYGRIARTPLVHVTVSKGGRHDHALGDFAKFLREFESRRSSGTTHDAGSTNNGNFHCLEAGTILTEVSCGYFDCVVDEFGMPAIRMGFPAAEMLPARRKESRQRS